MSFEAVAFDYDGVLGATQALHGPARDQAFAIMFEQTGDHRYADIPREIHAEAHRHGSSPNAIIGWVLKEVGIVPQDVDCFSDPTIVEVVRHKDAAYQQRVSEGADATPGAIDFIHLIDPWLPEGLAIGTTARKEIELRPFLQRHQLEPFFPEANIVAREDVANLKPDPEVYEKLVEHFSLQKSPHEMLVIEDSLHGIEAGKRAGATVVAIATTLTVVELEAIRGYHAPDLIVPDFFALAELIDTEAA